MAEQNDPMAEVMAMLEAEPTSSPAPGPDIPALRERLVMMYSKRYETYVGAKTTETLIESILAFSVKALSMAVKIKDSSALQNELKKDYIITKELSHLSGGIALRCGRLPAVANAFLITVKHVDFSSEKETDHHTSRDSDGYPLTGVNEVPNAKQSPSNF